MLRIWQIHTTAKKKKAREGLLALGEVGGQGVEVLSRTLTGVIKVSKLDGVEITDDVIADHVVKEDHVAGSHKIKDPLLTDDGIRADEEFHHHVLADIFYQDLLHRALHIGGIEILLRGNGKALLLWIIWGKTVLRLEIGIHNFSFLGLIVGRGRTEEAMSSDASGKAPYTGWKIIGASSRIGVEKPKGGAEPGQAVSRDCPICNGIVLLGRVHIVDILRVIVSAYGFHCADELPRLVDYVADGISHSSVFA